MLVSVVIPVFNAERFLAETMESVFRQSYPDLEIIVVDDGSTDGSRQVIESFGARVRLEVGPNRGASAARNRGTALARGVFVQYLDADDLLAPKAIANRVEALHRSGADVAYSDWQRLEESGAGEFTPAEVVARTVESVDPVLEIALFTDFWCPPATLLYRRSIVEQIGGWNETLPVIQDARFLLDAALCGARFVHVPGVGAFYRVHGGSSLSRRNRAAFVRDCFANALQIRDWWEQHGGLTPARKEALVKVVSQCACATFELDRERFQKAHEALTELEPGYVPRTPRGLRLLSRLAGYPNAEALALLYRRVKARLLMRGTHG